MHLLSCRLCSSRKRSVFILNFVMPNQIHAFLPRQLDAAFAYLRADADQQTAILKAVRGLGAQLGLGG